MCCNNTPLRKSYLFFSTYIIIMSTDFEIHFLETLLCEPATTKRSLRFTVPISEYKSAISTPQTPRSAPA